MIRVGLVFRVLSEIRVLSVIRVVLVLQARGFRAPEPKL